MTRKFFRRERDYLSRRLFRQTIRVAKQRRSIDRPTTMTRSTSHAKPPRFVLNRYLMNLQRVLKRLDRFAKHRLTTDLRRIAAICKR